MKFVTKQLLCVIFLFFFLSDNTLVLSRKVNHHSRAYRRHSRRENPAGDTKKVLNIKNQWVSMFVGFLEALGGENTDWYACLPKTWTTTVEAPPAESDQEDSDFRIFSGNVTGLGAIIGAVVDSMCAIKQYIISFIKVIIASDGKFFLQRRYRRVFRTKKGFFDWIKKTATAVYNTIKKGLQKAWEFISDAVKAVLDKAKAQIYSLKQSVMKWMQSPRIANFIEISKCLFSAGKFVFTVWETINGFITKVSNVIKSLALTPIATVMVVADIILAVICSWKEFQKAGSYFTLGGKQDAKNFKFYYYGLAIGTIASAIGNANTIVEAFQD